MSQENVEIVRAAYDAIARRDRERLGALLEEHLAPDFEIEAVLTGATYRGVDGLWELLDDLEDTIGYWPEVQDAVDLDDHVLVVLRLSGRGSRSGVPVAQEGALLLTFDGNTILSGKTFTSRAEAIEAAGLRQ